MFKKTKEKLNYLEQGKFCDKCGVFTNQYKEVYIIYSSIIMSDKTKCYCSKCSPNYDKIVKYPYHTFYYKDQVEVDEKGNIMGVGVAKDRI